VNLKDVLAALNPRWLDAGACLAGCLLPLSLAPFDLITSAFVSLSLLFLTTLHCSARRAAVRYYLYALGMYGVGTSWIYVSIHEFGGASAFLAALLVALFVAGISLPSLIQGYLFVHLTPKSSVGLPAVFVFAACWTTHEWLLTWLLTGFPWLFVGYSQLQTPLLGYASLSGVLAIGFVVALTSGLLGCLMVSSRLRLRLHAGLMIVAIWLAGVWLTSIEFTQRERTISVSLVQGNIDQAVKWRREMVQPIINTYLALTEPEWGRDVIIWPEAAITVFRGRAGKLLQHLDVKAEGSASTLILGIPDRDDAGNFMNAAIGLGAADSEYFKRRLVPFGEYVPMEELLRGLIGFFNLPMSHNKVGAAIQPPMQIGSAWLGMSICYEVVYPDLVRSNETVPGILATISNDSWFGNSIGPLQHFQMARMRAVENGRFMLRSTNNGMTAIIDQRGNVQTSLPQFEAGVLRGYADIRTGQTPFAKMGHLPLIMLLFMIFTISVIQHYRDSSSDRSDAPDAPI
jgi:apolipoprotein N-acyltransferase